MKGELSVGELHGPKVRGASANSPKKILCSDLLKLCLKKNTISLSSSLTQLCLTIRKLKLQGNGVKYIDLLTNRIIL